MFSGGYQGKYLRINLTNRTIEEEKINPEWLRKFLGGRGLAARFYYNEIGKDIKPLSSDNKLIFSSSIVLLVRFILKYFPW